MPPVQTEAQIALLARQQAVAKEASEAATPHVLAFFASDAFRAEVRGCCPEAAAMAPEELLERFRAEIRSAELAHAFPAEDDASSASTPGSHFKMQLGEEYGFFLNGHQMTLASSNTSEAAAPRLPAAVAAVLGGAAPADATLRGSLSVEEVAETQVFGCTPFADPEKPTWQEASDRMIYVAQNMRRVDFSSDPVFGNAVAVFSNSYVKDMVLIAAVDTGLWEMGCNKSMPAPAPVRKFLHLNCPAWDPPVIGTWDHFDHVILSNLGAWRVLNETTQLRPSIYDEARHLFARSAFAVGNYSNLPNMSAMTIIKYWETNVLGNVRFPDGVRFLIGSFPQLFGTANGRRLQAFAKKFGWPLVWAEELLQTNRTKHGHQPSVTAGFSGRALDPTLPSEPRLNATFSATASQDFEALWRIVEKGRNTADPGQWHAWWTTLATQQISLEPVSATRCGGDVDACIGADIRSLACICKQRPRQPPQQLKEVVV